MIAMQYSIALPADYDMSIIDRRIADKGHLTDAWPGLLFKAYLSARKSSPDALGANLYAPFYLWQTAEAMNAFLSGPAFAGLSRAFGRPVVNSWLVWHAEIGPTAVRAVTATRQLAPIPSSTALDGLRHAEVAQAHAEMANQHTVAVVTGFDPQAWSRVRFRLRDGQPAQAEGDQAGLAYRVGHVSVPDRSRLSVP